MSWILFEIEGVQLVTKQTTRSAIYQFEKIFHWTFDDDDFFIIIVDINVNFVINNTLMKWPEQLSKVDWCMVRYHHFLPHLPKFNHENRANLFSFVHFSQFHLLYGWGWVLDVRVASSFFSSFILLIDVSLMFAVSM